jgi:tRNA A37 threonylcarbamoyladenosine synthetase subunit TsaC/SUA5/YrdC
MNGAVFLTQTDTTIGFVSQQASKLDEIKKRPSHKHYIKAVNSLKTLQHFTRIPNRYKNQVRRSTKTTFILPKGDSYRVIRQKHHLLLLDRLKWVYTTSANLSNQAYDETFAREHADVIIEPIYGDKTASQIFKITNHTIKRIR